MLGVTALAIECHRENPGRGGLAGSARTSQQIAVPHPIPGDRAAQGSRDVILDQKVGEPLGTVFTS
jgi:hypothetical protein